MIVHSWCNAVSVLVYVLSCLLSIFFAAGCVCVFVVKTFRLCQAYCHTVQWIGQKYKTSQIKQLVCNLKCAPTKFQTYRLTIQSHTIPYHAMGNGQCERFDQTLIKLWNIRGVLESSFVLVICATRDRSDTLIVSETCT